MNDKRSKFSYEVVDITIPTSARDLTVRVNEHIEVVRSWAGHMGPVRLVSMDQDAHGTHARLVIEYTSYDASCDRHIDDQAGELKQGDVVPYKLESQGSADVEAVYMWKDGGGVIAIGIQMRGRSRVTGTGSDENNIPEVMIEDAGGADGTLDTIVSFPQYKGYDVWSADASKYTVHLCLVRKNKST